MSPHPPTKESSKGPKKQRRQTWKNNTKRNTAARIDEAVKWEPHKIKPPEKQEKQKKSSYNDMILS